MSNENHNFEFVDVWIVYVFNPHYIHRTYVQYNKLWVRHKKQIQNPIEFQSSS